MEALYSAIAKEIINVCPESFSEAWIEAKVSPEHTSQQVWCRVDGKEIQPQMPVKAAFEVSEALVGIQEAMKVAGQEQWTHCTFTLKPDGTFKLEVEYQE